MMPILTQTLGQRLQQLVLCNVMVAILGEIKGPCPQDPISDRAYSQNSIISKKPLLRPGELTIKFKLLYEEQVKEASS